MRISRTPHAWSVTPKRAVAIQRELADRVVQQGIIRKPRFLAGVDIAISPSKEECIGAVVLWDALLEIVLEKHVVRTPLGFPYVPGLLSFREAPAALAALRRLRQEPDVVLCDGQGYAHPRRFGLACHIGVLTDRPTIGCAKSVLVGGYENPGTTRGAASPLIHNQERVGTVLRTQDNVRPVFVSVGHRVSLASAVGIVLRAAVRYRLPEPTRLADRLVARAKRIGRIT